MTEAQKRVVLFGRTGDGKSTVANALVTGGIEPPMVFPASDAPVGCTSSISTKRGRGWTVTDTIGLGEASSGTMSNDQAQNELRDFLKKVKDTYSHIIFVQRADKVTELDELLWLLFTSIFEGAEKAFVILFTCANEDWLAVNEEKLPNYMEKYDKFVVDIPPITSRPVKEKRNVEIREKSLQKLEENLIKHFEKRGNKPSAPHITGMNDAELEEKSRSLKQLVMDFIRRVFDRVQWTKIASMISSLFTIGEAIFNMSGGSL